MAQLPDRHEQIRLVHAEFIRDIVATCGNPGHRADFETLLSTAEQNGWTALAGAVRRIANGDHDQAMFNGLDEEDQVIVDAILRGLQDPSTLPDPRKGQDATLAAPGLAHMIHAAATGNAQALVLVGNMAEQMSKVGGSMGRLASVIRPLINGERNTAHLCRGMNTEAEHLVLDILTELGKLERH